MELRNDKFFSNDPKAQYFRCQRCGDCCKTSDIPITVFDVLRLARHLSQKPGSIIKKMCRLGYHPCSKNSILRDEMLGVVFLFKDKPCRFLLNKSILTCGVYDVRPIVCENTPNPCNLWSIHHIYSTCRGLQISRIFPKGQRNYYRQISSMHARMLSLTARFFHDALELGKPLKELSARFGETPNVVITPTGERNTYELIETLDKMVLRQLSQHFDVMKETVRAFNAGYDILMYNIREILSKTLTSVSLKDRFSKQVGL